VPVFPLSFLSPPLPAWMHPEPCRTPAPVDACSPALADPHRNAASGCIETAPVLPVCHGLSCGPVSPIRHGMSSCHVLSFLEPCPVIIRMLCIYFYCDVIFAIIVMVFFFFFCFPFFLLLQFTYFFLSGIFISYLFFLYLLIFFRRVGPETSASRKMAAPW
jgi:hypothetical protein